MRSISGKSQILDILPDILYDESRFRSGVPQIVFFPESPEDIHKAISEAVSAGHKIVFAGAQTGITGGAVPTDNCTVISFSAMNKIRRVDWVNGQPILFCDPGVTLSSINKFLLSPNDWPYHIPGSEVLRDRAYFFPPNPTESTAQLGGAVATNASGSRSFRFGSIRNHIEQLTIILSSGDTLKIPRSRYISNTSGFSIYTEQNNLLQIPPLAYQSPTLKNAAGLFSQPHMDLIDLFIGSEGTLAAFSEIGIKLQPAVEFLSGMSFFSTPSQAFDFADFLRKDPQIASIEFFDESALNFILEHKTRVNITIPDFPAGKLNAVLWEYMENSPEPFLSKYESWVDALKQCESSFDLTWSGFDESQLEKLKIIRHLVPELINTIIAEHKRTCSQIRKIATDTALPKLKFRSVYASYIDIINKHSLQYVTFGHLGDYHLHINLIPSNEDEFKIAQQIYKDLMSVTVENSGTVSAEHGIGRLKKEYFYQMYSIDAINQMRKVKSALDSKNVFNTENLF